MAEDWEPWLERWTKAEIISPDVAGRIRAFETSGNQSFPLRWPVVVALVFGALALTAGILLFVSAHWDDLSATQRMSLLVSTVFAFHVAGTVSERRSPALSIALHTIGTVSLGAAIALAGQVYNLDEHWPTGILLWTLGAALGWLILRQWPQAVLTAILAPAWLSLEWFYLEWERRVQSPVPAIIFLFLIAVAYLSRKQTQHDTAVGRILVWIGTFAVLPFGIVVSFARSPVVAPATWLNSFGWLMACLLPLGVALIVRTSLFSMGAAAIWAIVGAQLIHGGVGGYVWDTAGAIALAFWGMKERRPERVNLGVIGFALTVVIFYFSSVMDKLGRSTSLVVLGALFLGGGSALERLRRGLVERTREGN